ncbi:MULTISPECIES: glycosyltransferase [Pseudomonas]|uniref:Glycosyltransferase n=1 Tax=Pseudomonas koreensis TaxID=198620 RepID=A0A9X2XHA5_9PSED|nr:MULTISPECIES: glycosyltransferase [Pseudomonas]MBV4474338.1 glycosyltransferase [Pseudomonas botevensis]MCU7248698.1 glycosyltransferase [Pseudomonas koreensis]
MKILLTVHQFFPEFSAGTEVLTLSVARTLIALGHEVRVFTGYPATEMLTDGERFDQYHYDGILVDRFLHAYTEMGDQTSKIEIGYDNHLAANFFERLLGEFKPDVVHFFHLNRLGTGLIEKAVAARIPAFYTPTDFWSICPTGQLLRCGGRACSGPSPDAGNCVVHFAANLIGPQVGKVVTALPDGISDALVRIARSPRMPSASFIAEVRALEGRLEKNIHRLNQLQGIFAPNNMIEALLLRHGVQSDIVIKSPYGINLDHPVVARDRASDSSPLILGFIGTLASHKGCHVLLKAMQQFSAQEVCLRIYGKQTDFPEYVAELHQLAEGNEAVAFCGTFRNEEIFEVLGGMDALVVPSVWNENTPLVVYSAQAAGCPVIASDVPGIAEAVAEGRDGLLFEPGSVGGLVNILKRLLEERGLLENLALNSRPPKSVSVYVDELLQAWRTSM